MLLSLVLQAWGCGGIALHDALYALLTNCTLALGTRAVLEAAQLAP